MAKINIAVLESVISSIAGNSKNNTQIQGEITQQIETAADDLIQEFDNSAAGSGITADFDWGKGSPIVSENGASIDIYANNNTRPSLYPKGNPEGVTNLVGLFDSGYEAGQHVYGMWHGAYIRSRTSFGATNFLESAKESFLTSHSNMEVTLNRQE